MPYLAVVAGPLVGGGDEEQTLHCPAPFARGCGRGPWRVYLFCLLLSKTNYRAGKEDKGQTLAQPRDPNGNTVSYT